MRTMRQMAAMAVLGVLGMAGSAFAEAYKVDPVHSMVVFQVGHLGVSQVLGRFNDPTGSIEFDPAHPEKLSLEVNVLASKIDTANAQRDTHLKSPDFFDAAQFPEITFKSTSVKKLDDKTFEVTGDLTLHGVTKPVTVKLDHTGSGKGMQGEQREGFFTTFAVKRSDFGMTKMIPAAGDEVKLTVNLEAIKEP